MTNILKDFVSFFINGLFLALEFILVFGMLLAALAVPYAIAIYKLGAMPGSTGTAWALFIGVLLMGVWFVFLIRGGRQWIRRSFEKFTRRSLKALGLE